MQLILASASSYRKQQLASLGLHFSIIPAAIDETVLEQEDAATAVLRLASAKAEKVGSMHTESLIIGCDQLLQIGNTVVGKPANHAEAVQQLEKASGKKVQLLSALVLLHPVSDSMQTEVITTEITYRRLDSVMISRYLEKARPYDACGSLKVEGFGIALLEAIHGPDPNAIIGLPLISLVSMLMNVGYPLFKSSI